MICRGLLRVCTTLCTTDSVLHSVLQTLYYRLCTADSVLQTLYYILCTTDSVLQTLTTESVLQTLHYRLQYRLQTTDSVGRAEGLLLAVSEASHISVGHFRRWNLTEMANKLLGGSVRVRREG
jgi:hypothetical protein